MIVINKEEVFLLFFWLFYLLIIVVFLVLNFWNFRCWDVIIIFISVSCEELDFVK